MRKYDVAGSRQWTELEKGDYARIVNALIDMDEFLDLMPSRTRYESEVNPVKRLCCPRGHEIIRLHAVVDIPMLLTGNEDHGALYLQQEGEESDNYLPVEQIPVKAASNDWGEDRPEHSGWYCAYQENALACDKPLDWGVHYCEAHAEVGEQKYFVSETYDPRVSVKCPTCSYRGTHRRATLLILYAAAVLKPSRKMVLES